MFSGAGYGYVKELGHVQNGCNTGNQHSDNLKLSSSRFCVHSFHIKVKSRNCHADCTNKQACVSEETNVAMWRMVDSRWGPWFCLCCFCSHFLQGCNKLVEFGVHFGSNC